MTTEQTWLITCRQWGAALAKITDLRIEVEELRTQNAALIEAARNVVTAPGIHWHPAIDALNALLAAMEEGAA